MSFVDAAFLVLLFVGQPIDGVLTYRKIDALIERGGSPDTVKLYRQTMVMQWVALVVLAAAWWWLGRPLEPIGFTWPHGDGWLIGSAAVILGSAALSWSWIAVRRMNAEDRAEQLKGLGPLVYFLPRTDKELNYSIAISATAGVVEEIVYRGYVLWCLSHYMPVWVAALVSSVAFGLGHTYQGFAGILKTAAIGFFFAALYLLTGSLLFPVIAHFLLDALQMLAVRELHHPPREPRPAT